MDFLASQILINMKHTDILKMLVDHDIF